MLHYVALTSTFYQATQLCSRLSGNRRLRVLLLLKDDFKSYFQEPHQIFDWKFKSDTTFHKKRKFSFY